MSNLSVTGVKTYRKGLAQGHVLMRLGFYLTTFPSPGGKRLTPEHHFCTGN